MDAVAEVVRLMSEEMARSVERDRIPVNRRCRIVRTVVEAHIATGSTRSAARHVSTTRALVSL